MESAIHAHPDQSENDEEGMDKNKDQHEAEENLFNLKRPESWKECLTQLWSLEEFELFKINNPDGYFYLLYLKKCAYFFATLSLFSLLILIPAYTMIYEPAPFLGVSTSWNLSSLDKMTLAVALDDRKLATITFLLICMYAMIAYYFLYQYCVEMSNFEF